MADQIPGTAPAAGQDPNQQPGTQQPAAQPAAQPPASAIPWLPDADELTVGYVQNAGWKSPADVIKSYQDARKFINAPMDKRLVMPNDDQKPEVWDAFYTRLGRPATADGYKLPIPEGADPAFAKKAAEWFFNHGVSQKAAEGLTTEWNNFVKAQADAAEAKRVLDYENDDRELQKEWGAAFSQNIEQARQFVRGMRLGEDVLDAFQNAMGHRNAMKLFQALGAKMGEAPFVAGNTASKFGEALTPAQAKAKIEALRADQDWLTKYLAGNVDCKAEMERLHRYAYPEQR